MTMTYNSTTMLRRLLDVVAGISEMATIRFSPEGAHLQTMDVAHVCLVDIRLPESWFEAYKCPAATELSTSLALLVKMLGCIESGQHAWLVHAETKGQTEWRLQLSGGDTSFTKNFRVPMFDLDDQLLDVPVSEADIDFTMSSMRWAKTIDELAIFGSVMTVRCGAKGTTLTTQDMAQGTDMSCLIGLEDVESYAACDEEFVAYFPVKLLQQASAARHAACLGPNGTVLIHITEERPIELIFTLGDGAVAQFIVAPRMDED